MSDDRPSASFTDADGRWPVTIDGLEYKPIPESWVDNGVDLFPAVDSARLYAVSVAHVAASGCLAVRYASRDEGVATIRCDALYRPGKRYIPRALEAEIEDWPRSLPASRHTCTDRLRGVESEHFEELWGDRLASVDRGVVA